MASQTASWIPELKPHYFIKAKRMPMTALTGKPRPRGANGRLAICFGVAQKERSSYPSVSFRKEFIAECVRNITAFAMASILNYLPCPSCGIKAGWIFSTDENSIRPKTGSWQNE
jgi:hypothetical protein